MSIDDCVWIGLMTLLITATTIAVVVGSRSSYTTEDPRARGIFKIAGVDSVDI